MHGCVPICGCSDAQRLPGAGTAPLGWALGESPARFGRFPDGRRESTRRRAASVRAPRPGGWAERGAPQGAGDTDGRGDTAGRGSAPPPPPPGAAPPGSARPRRGRPEPGAAGSRDAPQPWPRACWPRCWAGVRSAEDKWFGQGLYILAIAFALEVSVGKTNTVMALNGSDILLPCTFTTCIGFQDLIFTWYFNSTELIYHGKIKSKTSEPILVGRNPRVEFVGSTTGKDNNISIVLKDVELSDAGRYTCHVLNPKEKKAHNATIFLTVVHKLEETDNTVTLIIVGVVGGLIGLLILFMLVKRVVLFIIKKIQDGKKECLVSSSGNDNTENGLAGSKAEQKAPPKA
eukprot:XP_015153740.1 sodium channel subunit beta-4 isoform X1 [Gallus gallus]